MYYTEFEGQCCLFLFPDIYACTYFDIYIKAKVCVCVSPLLAHVCCILKSADREEEELGYSNGSHALFFQHAYT